MKNTLAAVMMISTTALAASTVAMADTQQKVMDKAHSIVEQGKKTIDDSMVTANIKKNFADNELLNPFKIHVKTIDGKVTLRGEVKTDMQYEEAITIAESTDGAKQVEASQLKVKDSHSALSDIYITAKVKGRLLKEKVMGDQDIAYWPVSIETKDAVVYLSGEVDSEAQKENIEKIVQALDGVKSVKNAIKVNS